MGLWAMVERRPVVSVLICERGGRTQGGIQGKAQRKADRGLARPLETSRSLGFATV